MVRANKRRKAGRCANCGGKPKRGRKTCTACIKKANERRLRWRAEGKCVDCRAPGLGKRRCAPCQKTHQEYKLRKRAA
jgi:hypothetical protein